MTDRHEVYPSQENSKRDIVLDELLLKIEDQEQVSQRSLSQELGIALGLTNLLVRKLVQLGWVQVERLNRNHARYLLTPRGLAERARIKQQRLERELRFYSDARDRVRQSLDRLSKGWSGNDPSDKRIAFLGANELTEIASVCLPATDLHLVGVIDDAPTCRLVGATIYPISDLRPGSVAGRPFERLVVMSLLPADRVAQRLDAIGYPLSHATWL